MNLILKHMGKFDRKGTMRANAAQSSEPQEEKPQGFFEWLQSLFSSKGDRRRSDRASRQTARSEAQRDKVRERQAGKTERARLRADQKRWRKSGRRGATKRQRQYFKEQYHGQGKFLQNDGD